MCGCVPRPAHPPHLPARRVGAALKGLGAGLRRQGIGAKEGGREWGRGAQCHRVSHVRPTYSPLPDSHRLSGCRALGAAGVSPHPGRGPRRPDNPALSSLYVTGLGLTEPVGPLQPCLGSRSCVDSHGKARDQTAPRSVFFSDCRPLLALPSDPPSRRFSALPWLFPTSCFLPGSGAIEV